MTPDRIRAAHDRLELLSAALIILALVAGAVLLGVATCARQEAALDATEVAP